LWRGSGVLSLLGCAGRQHCVITPSATRHRRIPQAAGASPCRLVRGLGFRIGGVGSRFEGSGCRIEGVGSGGIGRGLRV